MSKSCNIALRGGRGAEDVSTPVRDAMCCLKPSCSTTDVIHLLGEESVANSGGASIKFFWEVQKGGKTFFRGGKTWPQKVINFDHFVQGTAHFS